MIFRCLSIKTIPLLITLLRSMSFNAKEWIDHNEVRYNKTVVDFIIGLHDVLKVPRI